MARSVEEVWAEMKASDAAKSAAARPVGDMTELLRGLNRKQGARRAPEGGARPAARAVAAAPPPPPLAAATFAPAPPSSSGDHTSVAVVAFDAGGCVDLETVAPPRSAQCL